MEHIRKCGILLHPTSLPSPYGIGDIGKAAYDFIDFLCESKIKYWQVLPLNPTGFKDSPYQSFSAFAGNFYIISPDILAENGLIEKKALANKSFPQEFVDYGKVIPYKLALFEKAFINFSKNDCEKHPAYEAFCNSNAFWLDDYALFAAAKDYYIQKRKNDLDIEKNVFSKVSFTISDSTKKDYYYGGVWATWDTDLAKHDAGAVEKMAQKLKNRVDFYKFLQFEFFSQWCALKTYTNKKGIEIIGDMPIFTAWDSADVWAHQELFKLDESGYPQEVAGVPPDYFSKTGQLWGNPVYKWENHKKTGYKWWLKRIEQTLLTADKIRIDHFRGFESNYCIPFGSVDATKGEWKKGPGAELFNAAKESFGLPFIAEDLGIITDEVEKLRDGFSLPGMKVLQFAFDESENNAYLPHNFDKNTVVYTGTHDNDTTAGWYYSADEAQKDRFRRYMDTAANEPSWDMIRLAVASAADTAVFPLQDVLGLKSMARMNIPGSESGNWQWRFKYGDITNEHSQRLEYLCKIFKR